jgi:glycosyltransferase involved in cell wall biosynthesis
VNITFVAPHAGLSGGIRVIAMHALGLQRRGHRVLVVSQPLPRPPLRSRIRGVLRGKSDSASHAEHASQLDGLPIEHRVLNRPRPVIDADVPDADVVVATWWETADWVAALSARKGVKAYLIQGDEACFYSDAASQERVAATWRLPLRKAAVAQWLIGLGRERCPGHDLRLVPNAVDAEHFSSPARDKQSHPTIGLVSSPFGGKGLELMLGAFELARRDHPDLRLVSFGDPPAPGQVAWPAEFQLEVRPAQDRIPRLYASCDAWLFGSRREGFGLPILEAMACRTPVIGTPAGAAPEILAGGGGILVKAGDPGDMAAAIRRVIGMTPEQWRAMSDAAHRTAAAYSWDRSVEMFEAFISGAATVSAS